MVDLADLHHHRSAQRRERPPPHRGDPSPDAPPRRPPGDQGAGAHPHGHARADLRDPDRGPAQAARDRPRARLRLRVPGAARFRVNVYRQRGSIGGRASADPTGSSRSRSSASRRRCAEFRQARAAWSSSPAPPAPASRTTLASLHRRDQRRPAADHIMTVEDPIEFLHSHKRCAGQPARGRRGHRSPSPTALKHALRQDPDIILVGEMRDLETISVALTAAETGHLVFATLHTQDAAQTIDRIIDVFPPHQQQQVRAQLADALQGVVCQTLAPTVDGKGRAVVSEVMVATPGDPQPDPRGQDPPDLLGHAAGCKHGMHTLTSTWPSWCAAARSARGRPEQCHDPRELQRALGRVRSGSHGDRDLHLRGPATAAASSSRASSRPSPRPPSARSSAARPGAHRRSTVSSAAPGMQKEHQDPRLRRAGPAQGPGGHVPAVRDDDSPGLSLLRSLAILEEQTEKPSSKARDRRGAHRRRGRQSLSRGAGQAPEGLPAADGQHGHAPARSAASSTTALDADRGPATRRTTEAARARSSRR